MKPDETPNGDPTWCRSCGAQIFFARTEKGRRMPIDAEPVAGGNLSLILGPPHLAEVRVVEVDGMNRYVSHFATCPQSAAHRKGKT